jgi:hypothetical protein
MRTFIVTEIKTSESALFSFRESDGLLVKVVYPEHVKAEKIHSFISITRRTEQELLETVSKFPKALSIKPDIDLSFNGFWNAYTYKVGNKPKAEKLWDKLSENDKYAALTKIPEYNRYIARTGVAKIYPEGYLSQRRWENEFK